MFKPTKKKVVKEKEKVDFKLEFHASRVPQRGWDKLLVSVISLETGKVTAKTGKVSIKNGNCQWSECLYESTTISQDPKRKDGDKALYKLMVSMGLSRFGILGETSINLADYIQATAPVSVSLPLQNCNFGSILHVKIQCIMPKSVTSDLEDHKESTLEQDLQAAISDGEKGELDTNNPGDKLLNAFDETVAERRSSFSSLSKDDFLSPSTHRYSSDSLDIPSTPGVHEARLHSRDALGEEPMSPSSSASSSSARQESGNGSNDYNGFNRTVSNQESTNAVSSPGMHSKRADRSVDSHSSSLIYSLKISHDGNKKQIEQWNSIGSSAWDSTANMSLGSPVHTPEKGDKRSQEDSHRISYSQNTELEAAEVIVRDLRSQAASWEKHKLKLEGEIQTQAASWDQHKLKLEGEIQAQAAAWEQHKFKLDGEIQALKQQLSEETKRSEELQIQISGLMAERDNFKLEIESLKSMEKPYGKVGEVLVWHQVEDSKQAMRELQDELEYEKSMNSNLSLQLRKTQESNSELLLEIQDLEKLLDERKELEKQMREIQSNSDLGAIKSADTAEHLRKQVDSLKKELEELETDSQELTEENLDLLQQLKQANGRLNAQDQIIAQLESKNVLLSEDSRDREETEAAKLRAMVDDLREKLKSSEISHENKLANSRTLVEDLNSSVLMLRSKNSHLERQLQSSEEHNADLLKDIDNLKNENDGHEREKYLLASQRGQLKGLREKATKAEQDYMSILKRFEEVNTMNEKLKAEKASAEHLLKNAEERALESEKRCADRLKMVGALNTEKLALDEEMSVLLKAKEEAEATVTNLQQINEMLQEQCRQEQLKNSRSLQIIEDNEDKSTQLLQKLNASENRVKHLEHNIAEFEALIKELEMKVEESQEENKISGRQAKELERHVAALEEERLSLRESRSAFEARNQGLQSVNDELCEKLKHAREEIEWARENANTLVEEIRELEGEVESGAMISKRMEQSLSELEAQKSVLQTQIENLSEKNMQFNEKVMDNEAKHRNAIDDKEALIVCLKEKVNAGKEGEASLQTVINQQQNKIKQLQKEIVEVSKEVEDDLNSAIEDMKHELASKDSSQRHLQEQVQKLTQENTASAAKIALLNEELLKLHGESEENEKRLVEEIQELHAAREELQMKVDKTEEMLVSSEREKASAIERMQREIQELTHRMSSNCDDKEKLATQALSDSCVLRAANVELEEKVRNLQETLEQANRDASSLRENLEFKVDESLVKELEMAKKLEGAVREIEALKKEKLSYSRKVTVLEAQCAAAEDEKEDLSARISQIQKSAGENEFWQMEAEKAKDGLKQEKMKAEASVQRAAEELATLKERLKSQEEAASRWKQSKRPLEEKNESSKLRKQTSDLKRKLLEQEVEKEDLKKRACFLEEELQRKTTALALAEKKLKDREPSANGGSPVSLLARSLSRANSKVGPMSNISPSRDAKELGDLRLKVKLLEDEVKRKAAELEASKQQLKEQNSQLSTRIEQLELANDQLVKQHSHSNVDQVVKELNMLQTQNTAFFQRENELLSKLSLQEVLQSDLERLKEEKKDLENALSKFNAAVKGENIMKRISALENELAEVLESNNMYKSQLQSAFAKQQNVHAAALENLGSVDQVVRDLAELKRRNAILEDELRDMRERYFNMSIQFAEVEAEREELVMTVRNLRGAKKLIPYKSANF